MSHNLPVANALINMGSGVAAGMAATCTTQPFDMLKTRMQLKPMIYKNLLQSARKVYMVSVCCDKMTSLSPILIIIYSVGGGIDGFL